MTEPIRTSVTDGIRTITLDRGPDNPIDEQMMVKLLEIMNIANHDWETRVIVLESALPGVFSLGEPAGAPGRPDQHPRDSFGVPSTYMALVRHALRGIWDAKWPLIAKVDGTASGSGLLLAALADFAVVSETAQLCLPDARSGIVNGGPILRRCLPEQAMRYMMWAARPVEAKRLREMGAGMLIVPSEELDAHVEALASDIAGLDPHLLRHMKIAMNENESDEALAGHAVEQRYTALLQAKAAD